MPQVSVVHDLIPLAFPRDYPRQRLYLRRLVPAILRESQAMIAVSEATRREVIAAYGLNPSPLASRRSGRGATNTAEGP